VALILALLTTTLGLAAFYAAWRVLWKPNVTVSAFGPAYLYIRTGAPYQAVLDSLETHDLLLEPKTFRWLAEQRDYPAHIRPGRYLLDPGLGNAALLDRLLRGPCLASSTTTAFCAPPTNSTPPPF
jgi:UPF0755 protein